MIETTDMFLYDEFYTVNVTDNNYDAVKQLTEEKYGVLVLMFYARKFKS